MISPYRLDIAARVLAESDAGVRILKSILDLQEVIERLDEIELDAAQTIMAGRLFPTADAPPKTLS